MIFSKLKAKKVKWENRRLAAKGKILLDGIIDSSNSNQFEKLSRVEKISNRVFNGNFWYKEYLAVVEINDRNRETHKNWTIKQSELRAENMALKMLLKINK